MTIDWTVVTASAEKAVSGVLGAAWTTVSTGASVQLAAIAAAGQTIEQNQAGMTQPEYDNLKLMQQRALAGVLQTYQGISLVVAQQAAAAAWGAVASALKTAYPVIGLLL